MSPFPVTSTQFVGVAGSFTATHGSGLAEAAPGAMADWLLYLGAGLLTLGGALIGYVRWAYTYFKGELKDDRAYRDKAVAWLTSHALLAAYRDRLEAALDWLQRWMGGPLSLRALGVCITVSMVYSIVFFIASWAAAGPGTGGRAQALVGSVARRARAGGREAMVPHRRRGNRGGQHLAGRRRLCRLFRSLSRSLSLSRSRSRSRSLRRSRSLSRSRSPGRYVHCRLDPGVGRRPDNRQRHRHLASVVFFVGLPIANALLDWPSWWVSRMLGQHLLTIVFTKDSFGPKPWTDQGTRSGRRGFTRPCVDRPRGGRGLPLGAGGAAPVPDRAVQPLVRSPWQPQAPGAAPFPEPGRAATLAERLVVLAMLLSTLVPTLLHAMALVASPVMVWLGSSEHRREIAGGLTLDNPAPAAIRSAAWHMTWTWLIGITTPLLMLAGFVWLIGATWRPVSNWLLDAALSGMAGAFYLAHSLGWVGT